MLLQQLRRMSDIAEDVAEERRQIEDMLSPVKSSHVGAPSLDGDSEEQVGPSPCPSCSKVGAEVPPSSGHGFSSFVLALPPLHSGFAFRLSTMLAVISCA